VFVCVVQIRHSPKRSKRNASALLDMYALRYLCASERIVVWQELKENPRLRIPFAFTNLSDRADTVKELVLLQEKTYVCSRDWLQFFI